MVSFSGCAKQKPATSPAQILRIAQRNEPATLDPHLATLPDEFFIIRALGEGLLTPNPDGGSPLPGVAESWDVSDNGLVYTFRLRTDARWANGDPVTAGDFAWSIRRALDPATTAPKVSLFLGLKNATAYYQRREPDFSMVGVRTPTPHTLVLELARPNPDFPALVASGPWIPVHRATVETHGVHWTRPLHHIGNGPFTLAEWSPNQRVVIRRSPTYWDAAAVQLAEVHHLAFDNGDTEERTFRAGQLDVTMAVPSSKLESYRRNSPELLQTVPLHETRYLALNTTRSPLSDTRVRRALSLALDRQILADKVLKSGQRPAFTFVPPDLGGYSPAASLTENREAAQRLLSEAGFPGGKNFPKLELSTWGASLTVLEAVQQRWRDELGIEIVLVQREARTHLATLTTGDYDIGFVAAIPDYDSPADLLTRFTAANANNYPHWNNAEFDRLVAAGNWTSAEDILLSASPVIPLYFNAKNFLLRPTVRGWREDALWTRYYKHVSLAQD